MGFSWDELGQLFFCLTFGHPLHRGALWGHLSDLCSLLFLSSLVCKLGSPLGLWRGLEALPEKGASVPVQLQKRDGESRLLARGRIPGQGQAEALDVSQRTWT